MLMDTEEALRICERAGVRGRAREVLLLLAEGLDAAAVAERLEIAVATVHVHAHRARVRIARVQAQHEEVELHRFILDEALPGPVPSDPPHGLYRVTGPGQGERVRLRGALVTVDDLSGR